jgi:isopentenyl-diphosphate Delta-isomerase
MEILDVWNELGNKTNQSKSRDECHQKGLWHQTVHVWVINSKNELLIQQRQLDRESNPGKWDISAAGHIPRGQSPTEAALRELNEEVGISITPSEIEYLGRVKHIYGRGESWINKEYQEVYLHRGSYELEQLNYQESEVSSIKWIDINKFWKWSQSHSDNLVSHPQEYALVKSILDSLTDKKSPP